MLAAQKIKTKGFNMAICSGIHCNYKDSNSGCCTFNGRCVLQEVKSSAPIAPAGDDPISLFVENNTNIVLGSNYKYSDIAQKLR